MRSNLFALKGLWDVEEEGSSVSAHLSFELYTKNMESQEKALGKQFRKQLAACVRSIQRSFAIFWSLSTSQEGGTQQDILNAMRSIYAATLFIGITNATAVQPVVSIERFVSYRERAAGMYAALSFAFAQVSIELPYLLAQTLIYGTIFYSMASFEWKVQKFLWYIFFMYFTLLYFTFFSMMMTAITPNLQVAPIIAAPFFIMWNLFSGFLIPWKRLPEWWSWYYWANPLSWSLNGLLTSQFGDVEEQIKLSDGVHLLSVKQFLDDHFGFRNDLLGIAGVVVVCFCLLFALVFSVAFKQLSFQRR